MGIRVTVCKAPAQQHTSLSRSVRHLVIKEEYAKQSVTPLPRIRVQVQGGRKCCLLIEQTTLGGTEPIGHGKGWQVHTGTHDEVSMPDVDDVESRQHCEGVVRSRREPGFRGGVGHATNPTHCCAMAFSL